MDQMTLFLLVRICLKFSKNVMLAAQTAKSDDGKITIGELPCIIIDAALKSLSELGTDPDELKKLINTIFK